MGAVTEIAQQLCADAIAEGTTWERNGLPTQQPNHLDEEHLDEELIDFQSTSLAHWVPRMT